MGSPLLADASEPAPLLSLIAPAYNEAALLPRNLAVLRDYLDSLAPRYRWEMVIVDDGSTDETAALADAFAAEEPRARVVHHPVNLRLGQALRTGFAHARGDYVVVVDVDLSYAPEHIGQLADTLRATRAQVVVASPYMRGGRVTGVPWHRLALSRAANRFLAWFCHHVDLRTITGMVRGYDARFLRRLHLKAMDVDINTEVIYKTMLLRGRIVEIPAHLDWTLQNQEGRRRGSSFRLMRSVISYTLEGFTFRPFMFFLLPGATLLLAALYMLGWIVVNVSEAWPMAPPGPWVDDRFSEAVALVFQHRPHAFLVGGVCLMVAIQLLSLGFISFQSKRYFEELFNLGSRPPPSDEP